MATEFDRTLGQLETIVRSLLEEKRKKQALFI